MLWSASDIMGCGIDATDGLIGHLGDLLFDDQSWTVRWFVVKTGVVFTGREVLLPPSAILSADSIGRLISVNVTKQQVRESPEIDFDAPVSRQHESSIYDHYGWHPYWGPHTYFGPGDRAPVMPTPPPEAEVDAEPAAFEAREEGDPHLRSAKDVTGYYVHATNGDIGHLEDLVVDTDAWAIRYIAVDTVNWWPGKTVLISPTALTAVSGSTRTVNVDLTRERIRGAPEYLPGKSIDRVWETQYHDYYGYSHYWS